MIETFTSSRQLCRRTTDLRSYPSHRKSGGPLPLTTAWAQTVSNADSPSEAEFYHGEAVAVGMLYMAEGEAKERIEKLLKKYNLPTTDPFTVEELMRFAVSDKKRRGDRIKIVRVSEIGSYRFEQVDETALRSIIQQRKI